MWPISGAISERQSAHTLSLSLFIVRALVRIRHIRHIVVFVVVVSWSCLGRLVVVLSSSSSLSSPGVVLHIIVCDTVTPDIVSCRTLTFLQHSLSPPSMTTTLKLPRPSPSSSFQSSYQVPNNSSSSSSGGPQLYSLEGDMSHPNPGDGFLLNVSSSDVSDNIQYCLICGDKATGKHYGAYSCDGCKGFFRRSVRKKSNYTCQYNRGCKMDKDKRNQCRYCRLKKCILVGMKRAAVQNERDRISTRRSSFDDVPPGLLLSIPQLMQAEQRRGPPSSSCQDFLGRLADVPDVCESMKSQLFLLVDWAKSLPCFSQLSLNDQIALLKAHAGEILILGVIKRSFQVDEDDVLLLGNNLIISRHSGDRHFAEIASHILDDLFIPLRELQLDEAEFSCLKAIVFFDPTVAVSDTSKEFIRRCRYQIQMDLMNHMNDKQYHKPGRFGELLLAIPDLRYVTQMMVKKVEFMKMTGLAEIDSLLSETLLGDNVNSLFESDSNHPSGGGGGGGYIPPNSGPPGTGGSSYESMNMLRTSDLQSPPLYSLPSFIPNHQILLDINNQESANSIWSRYLPGGSSVMSPEHLYSAFTNQEHGHQQHEARLLNNMIINSDGMILKGVDPGDVPTLFSSSSSSLQHDNLSLYQHPGAGGGHDTTNFLVNLDQNFQILSQQQQSTKYSCGNNSGTEDMISQDDPRNMDPSLLVAYSKSLSNSPIDSCHLQTMSSLNNESNLHQKSRAIYSVNSGVQISGDQQPRKNEPPSRMFKSEDY